MANFDGTGAIDTLIGTADADVLRPYGTTTPGAREVLSGLDGADVYDLSRGFGSVNYTFVIDDQGTDGAVNSIIRAGAMTQAASFGYSGVATAIRVGDDLILHLPSKPYRFHSPSRPAYDIEIRDQYGTGHVATIEAGTVVYNLVKGSVGTALDDIMAGSDLDDSFQAGDGNDWLFGNGGNDVLDAGDGNDRVLGGAGNDVILASGGNNRIEGEDGHDRITTGDGADWIEGNAGNDKVWAGGGDDTVQGGEGRNMLRGQGGNDILTGGDQRDRMFGGDGSDRLDSKGGNDFLSGGKGGDLYLIAAGGSDAKVIKDSGAAPVVATSTSGGADHLRIDGLGGTYDTMRRIDLTRVGDDLVIGDDSGGTITIVRHFEGDRFAIELLSFGASVPLYHVGGVDGDLFTYSVHDGGDAGGEDLLLGTDGDDEIYGGMASDMMFGGLGADTYLFKDEEDNIGGIDIIYDFDQSEDRLDYNEIQTLTRADLTIADNAYGNAVISSVYGAVELVGIAAVDVSEDIFVFG